MNVNPKRWITLICTIIDTSTLVAGEYGGKWTTISKADVSWKLITNLKEEQDERLKMLEIHEFPDVPSLSFDHFPEAAGKAGARLLDRFMNGKLGGAKTEQFLQGIHQDLKANQDKLYEAEQKAAKIWKPAEGVSKNSIKEYTAKVLGEAVIASQIGVILDSSPSMKEYVEKLRTEISEQFRYSYFVEVEECAIDRPQGLWSRLGRNIKIHPKSSVMVRSAPWFYADPSPHLNPFLPNWHSPKDLSVLKSLDSCYVEWPALSRHSNSAFLAMIDLLDVDSIFWFSDFEDDVDEKMNNILVTLMKEKGIRLYLVSVDNKPSKMFRDYAKESGGSYRKERIRR
ncbi:MAG: hypothetical protein QNK83_02575 [Akkermansiaceae bacterium]